MNGVDRVGGFKSWVGAAWYSLWNGGSIGYANDKSKFFVGEQIYNEDAAVYQRIFRFDDSNPYGIFNSFDAYGEGLSFVGNQYHSSVETLAESVKVFGQVAIRKVDETPSLKYTNIILGENLFYYYNGEIGFRLMAPLDFYATKKIGNGIAEIRYMLQLEVFILFPLLAKFKKGIFFQLINYTQQRQYLQTE